jgi:hypothetical protein
MQVRLMSNAVGGRHARARPAESQRGLDLDVTSTSIILEDPGGARAQSLLTRWLSLQNAATGGASKTSTTSEVPTPELRAELWARRAEWLPADVARTTERLSDANEALSNARALGRLSSATMCSSSSNGRKRRDGDGRVAVGRVDAAEHPSRRRLAPRSPTGVDEKRSGKVPLFGVSASLPVRLRLANEPESGTKSPMARTGEW